MKKPKNEFAKNVLDLVKLIPKGRVTTFGAIAKALGSARSSRMVGWVLNGAHGQVPAHRVVNRVGLLTGRHHWNPPEKMQQLLEKEGVEVKDNQVIHFEELFWDPIEVLNI